MATCYICGKSHAEYRREVKTGNSYRTGISSRGRTSYSTQSHYGPRCVCAECALNIDYKNKKISGGASFFYGLCIANAVFLLFWGLFGGIKGFGIGCGLCLLFFIIGISCKKSKEAEADAWYEANKSQYIDNNEIKELASASEKFAKALEKDLNNLLSKIYRFKESANKCLVTSKSVAEFNRIYEECNTAISLIDAFINQGTAAKRDFDTNMRNQYGTKDIVTQTLDNCSSVWKNIIDQLVKEKSEIQQLQKRFILSDNQTNNESSSKGIVNNNIPLGYKTADVFDPHYWTKEFWENVTVEQVTASSPNGCKNTNSDGFTALFYAASYSKNVEVITALINKGCDVNAKSNQGLTVPNYLINDKTSNIGILREILKYKFDINQIYIEETLLTQALKYCPRFEIIKTLFEFGADANTPNSKGLMPIDIAAESKDVPLDVMKLLFTMGSKISEVNQQYTALTRAALVPNNSEKIELLIQKGYSVNHLAEEYNSTALCLACMLENNNENILTLIQNGANVNQPNCSNQTPLFIAIGSKHPENAKVLIDNDADFTITDEKTKFTPLIAAAAVGDIESLKLLVAKGADVNACDIEGGTAITNCPQSDNSSEVLDFLIKSGGDVLHESNDGWTVLFNALSRDKEASFIEKLINLNLDVNKVAKDGMFPLKIALEKETHPDVIQLLLDNGADRSMKDKDGNTMIQLALKNPNSEIVKFFID